MSTAPNLSVILYRLDLSKNMRRFYRLAIHQDLFGVWTLIREWGRIGRRGQTRISSFLGRSQAELALERHQQQRLARGYQLA